MIMRAADVGKTGYELRPPDTDTAFRTCRGDAVETGHRMDWVMYQGKSGKITTAPPRDGGDRVTLLRADKTHETHRRHSLAYASVTPGTVVEPPPIWRRDDRPQFAIEHPAGQLHLALILSDGDGDRKIEAAGITRTADDHEGSVLVPARLLEFSRFIGEL